MIKNNVYIDPEQDDPVIKEKSDAIEFVLKQMCIARDFDFANVSINRALLRDVLIRVDKRDDYFYIFHERTHINEYKRASITSFWINKLRPFWVSDKIDENLSKHINEHFCVFYLSTIMQKLSPEYIADVYFYKNFADELRYSLTNRDISQEALIVIMTPFYLSALSSIETSC
ncbi:MAG: hypothetical protein LBT30_04020 [Clostridiales bacterium]|jgi:hypothetical protein|nr:hypothetical protein [Clostridiales bacterium]